MSLTVEVPDEVMRRLQAAATARGISVEELAVDLLAQVPAVSDEFAGLVTAAIAEHREILDRLAIA